jgi:hypothetical protein
VFLLFPTMFIDDDRESPHRGKSERSSTESELMSRAAHTQ